MYPPNRVCNLGVKTENIFNLFSNGAPIHKYELGTITFQNTKKKLRREEYDDFTDI